ncbi:MAG: DUF4346 domain-containing protein [candidate division NC10 bacterium]|nr:DUF4346 domain-containing protein [candidate division NC10 bacterium]
MVCLDRPGKLLSPQHSRNGGVLDAVIEGRTAPELYCPAVEEGEISRFDHAAYLGRELGRAEHVLRPGGAFPPTWRTRSSRSPFGQISVRL